MKRVVLGIGIVLIACMTTYASGQQDSSAAEVKSFNIEAPATEQVVDVIGWTMPITDFYRTEFESLNAVKNLKVNVQYLNGASAQEQVRLALSGGNVSPYEIVHGANSQISEWGFPGWLMPLDELVEKYWDEYDLGDIPQTAWTAATVNGKIVGIPAVSNSFQLIYRSDLFEKHNIEVPKTYADVMAAAIKLKENEKSIDLPYVINLHAGWAWEIEFFQLLGCFGGTFVNEDSTAAFNGPEGVQALELLMEIAELMGPEGLSYSVDDTEIGLQTGRLAFANTWASRAVNMNNPEKSDYVEELKFAPSPAPVAGGKLAASAWNDFYCIPENIEVDPELVFKVIMETLDKESQMKAVEYGIPTRLSTMESAKKGAYMPSSMTGLSDGIGSYLNHPSTPMVRAALGEALPLAATGDYTAQEILDRAAKAYTENATANGLIK